MDTDGGRVLLFGIRQAAARQKDTAEPDHGIGRPRMFLETQRLPQIDRAPKRSLGIGECALHEPAPGASRARRCSESARGRSIRRGTDPRVSATRRAPARWAAGCAPAARAASARPRFCGAARTWRRTRSRAPRAHHGARRPASRIGRSAARPPEGPPVCS
jgi:hypothetical protein